MRDRWDTSHADIWGRNSKMQDMASLPQLSHLENGNKCCLIRSEDLMISGHVKGLGGAGHTVSA